jgi:hypothetical protein
VVICRLLEHGYAIHPTPTSAAQTATDYPTNRSLGSIAVLDESAFRPHEDYSID